MTRAVPWLLFVASTGVAVAIAFRDHDMQIAEDDEADSLVTLGQIVAVAETDSALADRILALEADNAELAAALGRAKKAAPGARPVAIVSASTGPVVAHGQPYGEPQDTTPSRCLLSKGDSTELRVSEVVLETRAGNRMLVGQAQALRLDPGPETVIASGAFSAEVSQFVGDFGKEPTFRIGAAAFASPAGTAVGLAYAPAPFTLWRLELEPVFAAGAGPGGLYASAIVLVKYLE